MLTKHTESYRLACPLLMIAAATNDNLGTGCLGAQCNLWRWAEHPTLPKFWPAKDPQATAPEGPAPTDGESVFEWAGYEPGDDVGAGWLELEDSAAARRKGFCGLGGEPRDEP
jgi:hypothetical protein